jgi:hypothetical protein
MHPAAGSLRMALLFGALACVLYALLFLGVAYTKTQVAAVLTAYDLSLAVLAALAIGSRRAVFDEPYFVVFTAVVAFYVLWSLAANGGGFLVVRQAAMFGYAVIGALVVSCFADARRLGALIDLLKSVAFVAVVAQLSYGLIVLLRGGGFGDEQYHYLSPAAIVFHLLALGFALTHRSAGVRIVGIPAIFLCLYMSGHSTAILSAVAMLALVWLRTLPARGRIVVIVGGIAAVPLAIMAIAARDPAFLDVNAMWRFLYWVSISKEILVDSVGVFGHGFGVPYASDATAFLLQVQQGYTTTLGEGDESFLSPPHNFLLTVAFHVGFLPACIYYAATLLLVFRLAVDRAVQGRRARDGVGLGLAIAGITAWASFNVIIELPHASLVYWLAFFTGLRLMRSARPRGAGQCRTRSPWWYLLSPAPTRRRV